MSAKSRKRRAAVRERIAYFDEPTDFSLVQGGPLFQFLLRAGLQKPPTDLIVRRVVVILLIAWAPLLLLTVLSGQAFSGAAVPFLQDLGAQARLLLSVPLTATLKVLGAQIVMPLLAEDEAAGGGPGTDAPRA